LNYHAPSWLPGGNLQTIYAARSPALPQVHYRRESWDTPDGDFIDLDWIAGRAGRPLVALFHGLEGCAQSHYALALMAALDQHGWNGVVVHFRGCGGKPNRKLRAYHSGDAAEIDWCCAACANATPGRCLPRAYRWGAMRCSNGWANRAATPMTSSWARRRCRRRWT